MQCLFLILWNDYLVFVFQCHIAVFAVYWSFLFCQCSIIIISYTFLYLLNLYFLKMKIFFIAWSSITDKVLSGPKLMNLGFSTKNKINEKKTAKVYKNDCLIQTITVQKYSVLLFIKSSKLCIGCFLK